MSAPGHAPDPFLMTELDAVFRAIRIRDAGIEPDPGTDDDLARTLADLIEHQAAPGEAVDRLRAWRRS